MDLYTAVSIVEGFGDGEGASTETQREAWQYLIDTGEVWKLQGWFGRTAKALIERGVCQLPGTGGR
jgi:hypothetical protein